MNKFRVVIVLVSPLTVVLCPGLSSQETCRDLNEYFLGDSDGRTHPAWGWGY
jgi:hypothetical protein